MLFEDALDLVFFGSDAVSFLPVYLRYAPRTIGKLHGRNALTLTPSALAVELP